MLLASVLKIVIVSCWWSEAILARSNIGASSNWPGATSLCRGLGGNTELEQLALGVHHEAEDTLGHRTEVVVVELLAFRRLGAEQCSTGIDQVRSRQEEVPIDQEVLLLRPQNDTT